MRYLGLSSASIIGLLSLLILAGVPSVQAASPTLNSLTITPSTCVSSSCPPNSLVTITISATAPVAGGANLGVVIFTPTGAVYVLNNAAYGVDIENSSSFTFTCSFPFGAPGTLSGSVTSGSGGIFGCSGSNADVWALVTGPTISSEETEYCNSTQTITTTGDGSTSQGGIYTVLGCIKGVALTSGQFNIADTTTGVPQFPLGLAALFAVMVPILLVLRKRTSWSSPRRSPAS